MTKVIVRRTKKEDIEFVRQNIRDADRLELDASSGLDVCFKHIESIIETSWTGLANDEIVVIFGISPLSFVTGDGVPWLVSTKNIEKYQIAFLKHCRKVFNLIKYDYKRLFNFVDERNSVAQLWLKWLGFEMGQVVKIGAKNLPFKFFIMEVEEDV